MLTAVYVDNFYGAHHLGHAHNIEIHRVTTVNAFRNGLSIISAQNLLVSNCSFLNTSGTPPMGACATNWAPISQCVRASG